MPTAGRVDTSDPEVDSSRLPQATQIPEELPTRRIKNRYGWRITNSTSEAVQFTFDSVYTYDSNNVGLITNEIEQNPENSESNNPNQVVVGIDEENANNEPDGFAREFNIGDRSTIEGLETPQDLQDSTENHCCHRCEDNMDMNTTTRITIRKKSFEMLKEIKTKEAVDLLHNNITESTTSIRSIGSFVCRICHNDEHPERLVSPCFCKGSLSYVHVCCLEHWISTSRKTVCELCQFQYTTIQTLRYTCLQSLRMWYSNAMNRRALQEDCQMLSLLTLVAFGIIVNMLVGIQYYFAQIRSSTSTLTRIWTKSWLLFFLFTTVIVYFINVYVIARGQFSPWYRWWQSAREIKLILENRKTLHPFRRLENTKATPEATPAATPTTTNFSLQNAYRNMPITEAEVPVSRVLLNVIDANDNDGNDGGRRNALASTTSDETSMMATSDEEHLERQLQQQQHRQPQEQQQGQHHNSNSVAVAFFNI